MRHPHFGRLHSRTESLAPADSYKAKKLALLLALGLACHATGHAASTPETSEPEPKIAMGCSEAGANWTLGKTPDDTLIAKAKTDAMAGSVRLIKPGHPVTMEYNGARLNLLLDRKGVIVDLNCG